MSPESSVLVAQLRQALTQQRYNPVVIGNYCRNADYFLSYLAAREIALEAVTPTDVANYLRLAVRQFRKRHGHAPARYWIGIPRSGIHGLLKLALKRWPPEPAATDVGELLCREICDQYQTWLREQRGLAAASIYALMWEARHFCAWYIKHSGAANFANLNVRNVDAYMEMRAPGLTRKSLKDVAERLRSLLKHLHRTGRTAADPSRHVVAPLLYAYEGIPSALSSDQIVTVLDSVRKDRSPMGLRDYAILQLLATYGLRSGEKSFAVERHRLACRHLKHPPLQVGRPFSASVVGAGWGSVDRLPPERPPGNRRAGDICSLSRALRSHGPHL
jgi:integrase/recombinase XerD